MSTVFGADAPAGEGRFAATRDFIQDQLREEGVASLAVAVAHEGAIVWEEAFGWADREERRPATPHTLYSLASVSKPITTTGLMILQERGLVDLDRPVNGYLGDVKLVARVGDAAEATVRRVANHTAGLPLHYHFFPTDRPASRPPMEVTLGRYGNLIWAPGERYQYSNLGYGILDHLISRLSGESYADFMRAEVFLPLGMTRASVDLGPGLERFHAARYLIDGERLPFYDFDHPGGSAIYCSAHDLVRFGMFHLGERLPEQRAILAPETRQAMQDPTIDTPHDGGYGVGWAVEDRIPGHRMVSHGGGMAGVNTLLTLLPAARIAIAVLANSNTQLPLRVADRVAGLLVPEIAAPLEALRERTKADRAARQEAAFQPRGELLEDWEGIVHTHQGDRPLRLSFKETGDLHARFDDQLATLVNDLRFEDGWLTGRFWGEIGTEDAGRLPHHLHLNLKLRDRLLNGALVAVSRPGTRLGNGLSHWAELKKVEV